MKASTIGVIALGALLLGGCETLNGPQAVANADEWRDGECKAIVVTNTPDQMRMQNRDEVAADGMKRTEGTLALAGVKKNEPDVLRNRIAPEESLTSKTLRGC